MKTLLFISFFLLILSNVLAQEGTDGKLTTIHLTLDDKSMSEDQWVYWFCSNRKGRFLVDSCYIEKGQQMLDMQGYLNDEEYNKCSIFFSKKGPDAFKFFLYPGDRASANMKTHKYEGSVMTEEFFDEFMARIRAGWQKQKFELALKETTDTDQKKQLSDSIEYYNYQILQGIFRENFNKTQNPYFCYYCFLSLREFFTNEEYKDYLQDMKSRFPHSGLIQYFPEYEKFTQNAEENVRVRKRWEQLQAQKHGIQLVTDLPEKEKKELTEELISVKPYSINDTVKALTGNGQSGEIISMEDIKTPYILIDFWASWCTPCLRDFPNVKKTLEQYQGQLSVYAISLDDKDGDWKRIIKSRELEAFSHIRIGGWDTKEGRIVCNRFGITAIPANFLLDKDRRIIATNLRGEDLIKKMEELEKQIK